MTELSVNTPEMTVEFNFKKEESLRVKKKTGFLKMCLV